MNCVGTMKVCVTCSAAISLSSASGENCSMITIVAPSSIGGRSMNHVPLEYSDVVASATELRVKRISRAFEYDQCRRALCVCTMPFGTPVVPDE